MWTFICILFLVTSTFFFVELACHCCLPNLISTLDQELIPYHYYSPCSCCSYWGDLLKRFHWLRYIRHFISDWDEIWCIEIHLNIWIDWESRISDMALYFQYGGYDVCLALTAAYATASSSCPSDCIGQLPAIPPSACDISKCYSSWSTVHLYLFNLIPLCLFTVQFAVHTILLLVFLHVSSCVYSHCQYCLCSAAVYCVPCTC